MCGRGERGPVELAEDLLPAGPWRNNHKNVSALVLPARHCQFHPSQAPSSPAAPSGSSQFDGEEPRSPGVTHGVSGEG